MRTAAYSESYWLKKLLAKVESDFFELLEQWDQYSAMSALTQLTEDTQTDVDEELTEEDEQFLDGLDFSFLTENEKLGTLSYNLNERIEARGYFIEDYDGKGFYKEAVRLIKHKVKSLK